MVSLTDPAQAVVYLDVIVYILDCVAALLRFLARRSKRVSLGVDDYLIFLSVPMEFTYIVLLLWGE